MVIFHSFLYVYQRVIHITFSPRPCPQKRQGSPGKLQVAEFTIAPRFAYDDLGAPPLVPPDATLVFEVELMDWENKSDVLGGGRRGIPVEWCGMGVPVTGGSCSKMDRVNGDNMMIGSRENLHSLTHALIVMDSDYMHIALYSYPLGWLAVCENIKLALHVIWSCRWGAIKTITERGSGKMKPQKGQDVVPCSGFQENVWIQQPSTSGKNESLSAWGVFLVEVRGLVRSHYRDHRDPNSTQPRCSQWRSRQERVPCYKNTLSWNTQHLGTRWCSCLGLATLHFMDCIRKIFSGNSATQTITSTRIQMIQLYRFASNYAFFCWVFNKNPLETLGNLLQSLWPFQVGAPDFGTISPIILEVLRSMSQGERCHVAWRNWTSRMVYDSSAGAEHGVENGVSRSVELKKNMNN